MTTLRDLASPVAAFVRERCKLGGNEEADVDELYKAFKAWAEANDYPKSNKAVFGRDLRAACASVKKTRPRDKSKRRHVYAGIALRSGEEAEAEPEQPELGLTIQSCHDHRDQPDRSDQEQAA